MYTKKGCLSTKKVYFCRVFKMQKVVTVLSASRIVVWKIKENK